MQAVTHWLITPQSISESMRMWCGLDARDCPTGDRATSSCSKVTCERCVDTAREAYEQLRAAFGGEAR